jgi:hypothetical protein
MRTLLFVFFIFAGLITFFTQAMVFASQVNALAFWGAVTSVILVMVFIGCWDLSPSWANRIGWLYMILMAAFCILTTLPRIEGTQSLVKLVFFGLYAFVGVVKFIGEKGHDSATAH